MIARQREIWRNWLRKNWPFWLYLGLALLILGPLLKPGYLFLLDWSEVPGHWFNWRTCEIPQVVNCLALQFLRFLLGWLVSGAVWQKILLVAIFTLTGFSMFAVLPRDLGIIPRVLAGIFYLVNPFVYQRFLAGHIGFLLGYAILPWAVFALFQAFRQSSNRHLVVAALWWTLATVFSVHYIFIVGTVFLATLAVLLVTHRQRAGEILITAGKFLGWWGVFNAFWFLPLAFTAGSAGEINWSHFWAYRPAEDTRWGLLINLLGMYGFWRERTTTEILLTKDYLVFWPFFLVLLLVPAGIGIRQLIREGRFRFLTVVLLVAILSLLLSTGGADTFWQKVIHWLFLYLPGFKIMRESQKFLALLVLVYSILIAWGFKAIASWRAQFVVGTAVCGFLVLLGLYNFLLFWGAGGQLSVREYPASWIKAKQIVESDYGDFQILILPWQLYVVNHPLAQWRTIADPAPRFFYPQQVLACRHPQIAGVTFLETSRERKIRELLSRPDPSLWQKTLSSIGVKYIFAHRFVGDRTPQIYGLLKQSPQFSLLVEDEFAGLFKVAQ